MKKVQKGFTLVELIVVITILAILATIAFISLQGYSQDARNSKVASDIRTLASSIETALTDGTLSSFGALVGTASAPHRVLETSGQLFGPSDAGLASASGATYEVGIIDFVALRQNSADFKDNSGNDYIAATAVNGSDSSYYQVVGQTTNADSSYAAIVKGNYISSGNANNVLGLVSESGATDTGITNADSAMTTGLY